MRATSFFIIALLFVCSNADFLSSDVTNDFTMLAELDNHHFGSAVLSTIAVQLETEAPMAQINALLEAVRQGLDKDQKEANKRHAKAQAGCDHDIALYTRAIKYHKTEFESNSKILSVNIDLQAKATKSLALTKRDLKINAKRESQGSATRNRNHQDFVQNLKDHDTAIIAIDRAVGLVEHLQSGTSFIQLQSHFNSIQENFNEHAKKHAIYTPLVAAMAQLATNADQGTVKKILGLLARIRKQVVQTRSDLLTTEAKQAKDWDKLHKDLEEERATLTAKKSQLQGNIVAYNSIISSSKTKKEQHSIQLLQNQANLTRKTKYCKSENATYAKNKKERKRERSIIIRLQKHLAAKLGSMKSYLKQRVNKK